MNIKTIAAISLSNRDYPSFAAKLDEAIRWIDLAARQGAELVVLPELLNQYYGDGPEHPNPPRYQDMAFSDWRQQTRPLLEAAKRLGVAITVPVLIRESGHLSNCFFFVDGTGEVLGVYRKMRPTLLELDFGVKPGPAAPTLIEWKGLKIGGAICFDTTFPEVFEAQAEADLFLVPSLWPGGSGLDFYALEYSAPIVLAYPAWSRIIDLDGRETASGGYRNETLRFGFGTPIVLASINFDRMVCHADGNAGKIVEIQRTYGSDVRMRFDQPNALWTIEATGPELRIGQIRGQFGLETRKQFIYLSRIAAVARA